MSRRDTFAGRNIDWMTLVLTLALMLIGWLMIYAVGYEGEEVASATPFMQKIYIKQAVFIGISIFVLFTTYIIDWRFWQTFSFLIYVFSMLLLLGVLFFGKEIKGATSWYSLGGFTLQPSEFAKFGTALAMAAYLSRFGTDIREFKSQATSFGLFLLPVALIMMQSDPGSAVVFSAFLIVLYRQGLSATFYIVGGVSSALLLLGLVYNPLTIILALLILSTLFLVFRIKKKLYWLIGFAVIVAASIFATIKGLFLYVFILNLVIFLGFAIFNWLDKKRELVGRLLIFLVLGSIVVSSSSYTFNELLKPHHQARINAWLQPSKTTPLYNVVQSKLAIGSGGFYGKGYLNGTMTKLDYVPEQSTDFIFCTVGEEQGFLGSVGILSILFLLIYRIVVLAERQRSEFVRHYAYGIAGILFIHCFVNIGMTMGLVPVVGIPLPFISYGGSSILAFSLMIGVLLKLDSQRYVA